MALWIDSIYLFDYRNDIGYYDSLRNFSSPELTYIGLALSTPKIRVNASPLEFCIPYEDSNKIREYVSNRSQFLKEITLDTAKKDSQYILISYSDGSDHYFTYDPSFCHIFYMALKHNPEEKTSDFFDSKTLFNGNPLPQDFMQQVKTNSPQQTYYSHTTSTQPSSEDTDKPFPWKKFFLAILLIFCAICLLAPLFSETDESNNELTPIAEPMSGYVLTGKESYGGNTITITAPSSSSCVVKLKTRSGVERVCFYVRAGEKIRVGVPEEKLYVYFATGKTWYGLKNLFGSATNYYMDDELIDFAKYSMTYTLTPVTNGNFSQTPIDKDDF